MAKRPTFYRSIKPEKVLQVWKHISRLSHEGKHISSRGVARDLKFPSSSTAYTALRHLMALGYIRRGPPNTGGSWIVDIWYGELL